MKWLCALLLSCSLFAAENEIIITENGTEMLAWAHTFIEKAEKAIEFAPHFFGGEIAQELLLNIERQLETKPELQVHILATPVLMDERDEAVVSRLEQRFPHRFHLSRPYNVLSMNPVGSIDNHMKMLIVDEKYYSMGGSNFDDIAISEGTSDLEPIVHTKPVPVDLPSGSRDQDFVGRGELAKQLRVLFFKMFAIWEQFTEERKLEDLDPERYQTRWFPIEADTIVESFEAAKKIALERGQLKIVVGGPHQASNLITEEYVHLLKDAKKSVWIANLYFNPAKPIFDVIRRGAVPYTIVTNGVRKRSPKCNQVYCWAHRVNFVPAIYGRSYRFWQKERCERDQPHQVEIFEYDVKNVVLHKKTMVVDDEVAVIGSYNLGSKSNQFDYELIAVMRSKPAAAALKRVIQRDIEHSAPVTLQEARDWYFNLKTAYLGEVQKEFNGFL